MVKPKSTDEFFRKTFEILRESQQIEDSDPVIFVHRHPFDQVGLTNQVTVKYPGD
jgi:hypothetical protein